MSDLARLEGLAIGLEQRGEKSAAQQVRLAMAEIERLRADLDILRRHYNLHPDAPLSREKTFAAKDAEIERLMADLRASESVRARQADEIQRLQRGWME